MKTDLVSIIIPVYNGSNYIRQAINCALNQTYKNIEIIVVNDGSTDNGMTEKICLEYQNKIRYFFKENGGVSSALNFGIKKMRGKYFSWLSHDDLYSLDRIEKMVANIDKSSMNEILFSNFAYIDENNKVLCKTHFERFRDINLNYQYAIYRGLLCGLTLLIPKSAFEEITLFDENLKCVQDYMAFFKFLKKYKYRLVKECTAFSRVHSKQVTLNSPKMQYENAFLWKFIIDNTPNETILALKHDNYSFYDDLSKFLKYNNISEEAYIYCIKKRDMYPLKKHKRINCSILYPLSLFEKMLFYLRKDGIIMIIKKVVRRFFYEKRV